MNYEEDATNIVRVYVCVCVCVCMLCDCVSFVTVYAHMWLIESWHPTPHVYGSTFNESFSNNEVLEMIEVNSAGANLSKSVCKYKFH